jgi:alcohol dehydrogenase class IV
MSSRRARARNLLKQFKGSHYAFGPGCTDRLGPLSASLGGRAILIMGGAGKGWSGPVRRATRAALDSAGVELVAAPVAGPRPNAPREDVRRLADAIARSGAGVIVAAGAGSLIDAAKAASCLAVLGDRHPDIEDYFGVGCVTDMLESSGRSLPPLVASQWAASSAAHLTKYSNVTDLDTAQKKLIVDDAITPERAVFDYSVTTTMPPEFTADGGLDGISHALEVYYGLSGQALAAVTPVSTLAIELIVTHLETACRNPGDEDAREALGLGTDLGGYAIMMGGTNGGHLTSFSLVDCLPHGRACAVMNPYYTVFFAPAIEPQLRAVGSIYQDAGYMDAGIDPDALSGRDLGRAVAEAMLSLCDAVGLPTRLEDVPGFTTGHIDRALEAAKNPQLEMKLRSMPIPLSAETVEDHMRPVLEAARTGDLSLIESAK